MNRTLEQAVDAARTFPDDQQEALGRKLLQELEEMQIDARIAEAEARGGELDGEKVFDRVRADIESGKIFA